MKTMMIEKTQTMTSLEIAELTGKQHKHVMEAIRKMEPAWEKVHGSKFRLMRREVAIGNGAVRQVPCYQLTKTECLYVATKFNDEARAKLVLRWEELERTIQLRLPSEGAGSRSLPCLRALNADAEDTLTATQVAKTFNMTVWDFNHVLNDMGILYRRHGRWNLSDDLTGRKLTALRTHVSYSLKGELKVKQYLTWTLEGLRFLNSKLGYPNF